MAALLALFLAGAPLSWLDVGRWVHQGGLSEERAQRTWHVIPGVVLHSGPSRQMFRLPLNTTVPVVAMWAAPGGRWRVGEVAAPAYTPAGAQVQVWVDQTGQATGPPLSPSELAERVIGIEMLAAGILTALLLSVAALARSQLNRRRLAGWESQWALIGPRWSRHHR
jgi:hypothetical protein